MADKKVSQLTALTGANAASGDLLYIVDVSEPVAADQSKKITLTEFQSAPVSAGTANGVAYLNASKVLTTGNALTFDGTKLGVGVASPGYTVQVKSSDASVAVNSSDDTSILRLNAQSGLAILETITNTDLRFRINSSEQMRLTSTGLGIGTGSPAYKLDVSGTSRFSGAIGVGTTPAQYGGLIDLYTNANAVNTGIWVRNDSAGSSAKAGIVLNASGNSWRMSMGSTANNSNALTWEVDVSSPTTLMTLGTSGNLGIGTSSPQARLEIAQSADNTDGPKLRIANNGNTLSNGQLIGGIDFFNGDDSGEGVGAYIYSYTTDSIGRTVGQDLRFATGGTTERMRLDSSGNLGLGVTPSGGYRLDVAHASAGEIARFSYTGGTKSPYIAAIAQSDTVMFLDAQNSDNTVALGIRVSGAERARITSGGDFLIGTTTSQDPLTVNGGATLNGGLDFSDTGTKNWQVVGNAIDFYIGDQNLTRYAQLQGITTFTAWTFVSDRRLKHQIKDLHYGLDALMQIKPREFNFIKDDQFSIGFIAQELKEVIPEAVTGNEIEFADNDSPEERASKTMGISKEMLIPVLVKAIQEQQAMINELKAEVAALKGN